jgi:hypothetical protein
LNDQKSADRDIRLDALRGCFLIIIAVDHWPSILRNFTYEFVGYVSAAEGFVFLSGFVIGLTYTRLSFQQGQSAVWRRALLRASTIYFIHVCTFVLLLFALRALAVSEPWWETWMPLIDRDIGTAVLMGVTFLSQPRFLDILPMYCLLVLATPFVIIQLRRKNALFVIAISFLLWILAQVGARGILLSSLPQRLHINLGDFDLFAWQVLFFGGLYCGFRRYTQGDKLPLTSQYCLVISFVVAIVLFSFRHHWLVSEQLCKTFDKMADRPTLGIVRLVNFAAICFLLSTCFHRFKNFLAFDWLAILGRNSLAVFAFQVVLVCFVNVILVRESGHGEMGEIIFAFAGVASLYFIAWLCEQRKQFKLSARKC